MAEPYLGIEIHLHLFGRFVSISSPNWNHDELHQPSLFPKWGVDTLDLGPNHYKLFKLDWFFHLCVIYDQTMEGCTDESCSSQQ